MPSRQCQCPHFIVGRYSGDPHWPFAGSDLRRRNVETGSFNSRPGASPRYDSTKIEEAEFSFCLTESG